MSRRSGQSRPLSWHRSEPAFAIASRARPLASLLIGLALLAGCAGGGPERGEPGSAGEARLALDTGSMNVPRAEHTATRLLDGRVLVAGGLGGEYSGVLASAEVYDPGTGLWTTAAPLSASRVAHTATLLSDGRALVLGGVMSYRDGGGEMVALAEVYHPGLNAWTAVAPMASPRSHHTATRLADGRILVAGSEEWRSAGASRASCELYDPATDTWSAARPMLHPRARHDAALLLDGRVLVACGAGDRAEIYDPASDTWSPTGPMAALDRSGCSASLLPSGKVLVTGGVGPTAGPAEQAEVYDPSTNTWTAAPGLSGSSGESDRYRSGGLEGRRAVSLPSGKVLVLGAMERMATHCMMTECYFTPPYMNFRRGGELYDPATGGWTSEAALRAGRAHHTLTPLLDGRVLAAGGYVSYYHPDWYEAQEGRTPHLSATASAELFTGRGVEGAPCSSAFECGSGFCADGVCCDTACDGACDACALAAGGARDGTCSPLTGPACDDGNACTQSDACQSGACAGAPAADGAPCDDGNACTQSDACQTGACAGAPAADGAPCDDGDACTQSDACQAGACAGGAPVACAARDACHQGVCDPASGRCVDALAPAGVACDDGERCTNHDECRGGACAGLRVECHVDGSCLMATCDEATGGCGAPTPKPDGAACNDDDVCTLADVCQAGVCTGSDLDVCPPLNSCHDEGVCLVRTGGRCPSSPLPDGTPCPDPTTSAWAVAAPMSPRRYDHSATRLQDGTVLVVGGAQPSGGDALNSAARFDPTSDTWTPVSPTHETSGAHRAVLLQDGGVFVMGDGTVYERYDPETDAWTTAVAPRNGHEYTTFTPLPNGKILVTGFDRTYYYAFADLLDPETNAWTSASAMNYPHVDHTAVLLRNGKVLIAGGRGVNWEGWYVSTLPELYDPLTNSWRVTAVPRFDEETVSAAVLLDGKVLVVHNPGCLAELYDPESDRWAITGPMNDCGDHTSLVLLADGRVAAIPVRPLYLAPSPAFIQLYDPLTGTWTIDRSIGTPRASSTVTPLADGRVLFLGGCAADCSAEVESLLYTPGVAIAGDGACESGVCVAGGGGEGGAAAGGSGGGGEGGAAAGGSGGGGEGGAAAGGSGGGGEGGAAAGGSGGGGEGGTAAGGSGGGGGPGGSGGEGGSSGSAGSGSAGTAVSSSVGAGGAATGGEGGAGGDGSTSVTGGAGSSASTTAGSSGGTPTPRADGCSAAPATARVNPAPWLLLAALLGARGVRRRRGAATRSPASADARRSA
ncbi:Kelch repeat-containing protein [Sorangium cellulosum]|nr:kelch repeat-containing protein [Sorangium cellulosum]